VNVNTELNIEVSAKDSESKFAIGFSIDLFSLVQLGEANISGVSINVGINSECFDPVVTVDYTQEISRTYHSTTCLFLHFPYPAGHRVLLGDRIWDFVQGDPDKNMAGLRPVNINQLYVHHIQKASNNTTMTHHFHYRTVY